ncbi:MAG: polymer-forming cytoskeletal protein [Alphaproteobacteria bacterium]
MFSKTDRQGLGNGVPSIISADLSVSGDLSGDGVMQIDGTVNGDIRCAEVTIGQGAQVYGQLECDTVHVHGTVTGEIRARAVSLSSTARVIGDIQHEELSIEAGAYMEGQLLRRDAQQSRLNLVVGEREKA